MKILIPLKQVPDSTVRVKVAPDGTSIVTEGITWSISPYDEYAIEMALERKDADPTTIVAVVTVGPARSRDALRPDHRSIHPMPRLRFDPRFARCLNPQSAIRNRPSAI